MSAQLVCCGGHRERCRFGGPHTWCIGFYDAAGTWHTDAKCGYCDAVCTASDD